ncbi:hypothetical protein BJF85_02275 [Saccharomonospora sp. CUA-673]|uniref:hypothetical protein n=1 Tax=Saccharomonospora sp. CUA-673 TaxID=1904969 RepID=UPI000968BC1F|nr:hypothetical protein [Saccharomonospora sp. CUA-673]OLT45230.1 hypothetical protein BJF85_02275 [Saccharomonospora sp. CUA-673]
MLSLSRADESVPTESDGPTKKDTTTMGFRPDVEGLRALAIGAVLLYHAGVPFVPGGYVASTSSSSCPDS